MERLARPVQTSGGGGDGEMFKISCSAASWAQFLPLAERGDHIVQPCVRRSEVSERLIFKMDLPAAPRRRPFAFFALCTQTLPCDLSRFRTSHPNAQLKQLLHFHHPRRRWITTWLVDSPSVLATVCVRSYALNDIDRDRHSTSWSALRARFNRTGLHTLCQPVRRC